MMDIWTPTIYICYKVVMSRKNILLTLIIPTYNSESCLEKNLKQLAKQTCQDFSVVIVDDNSTDQTVSIAQSYQYRIVVKPKSLPRGAAASLNYILPQIKTPYIALIDSDAYLADNWVEVMLKLLPNHEIIGAPILADNQNGLIAQLIGLEIESRYEHAPQELRHLSTCNLALNISILKDFHFNEKLLYAYDSQLSFWLSARDIKFYLTRLTHCYHGNKSTLKNYLNQQFQIAANHTALSKNIPRQALKGSEISPGYLIWQLPLTLFMIIFLFFNYYWSLVFFILILLLNSQYLIYLNKKSPYGLIFPAILLILLRNIAWIFGFGIGLFKRKDLKLNGAQI